MIAWLWTGKTFKRANSVPLSDRGFRYGMSVFESLRVTNGEAEFFEKHTARLVQACADTLRADRFRTALVWLNATDDVRRAFLTEAGWAPDGAHRELDLHGDGSVRVKQVRLHTDLTGPTGPTGA